MPITPVSIVLVFVVVMSQPLVGAGDVPSVSSIRDEVRARRAKREVVMLQLVDGGRVVGSVGRTSWRKFEVIDEQGRVVREVSYAKVRAFLDPATGQIIAVVRETWIDRHPGRFVALLGVGVGVALFVYIVSHIPYT